MTIADLIAYRTGERTETLLRTVLRLGADYDRNALKTAISTWAATHIPERLGRPDLTVVPGASIEGPPRWATAVDDDAFALHLAYADRDVARRTWITDLAVSDEIDSVGLPTLDLTLSVRQPVGAVSPPRHTPRVLPIIGDAVGLYDGATRLQTAPKAIDRTNVGELFETLHDRHRHLPMIVMSPPYALDATELARGVYGAAHVLLLDTMSTWRLGDELGPNWRVFDGAVRIFGPHFAAGDRAEQHPRWLGRTIEGINHRAARAQESDFTAILARHVFATAAAAAGEIPITNVDALELRRFARKREQHAAIETPATPIASDSASTPSAANERTADDPASVVGSLVEPIAELTSGPTVETVAQKLALIQADMESLEATLARKDVEIAELRTMLFDSRRHADELERAYLEVERAYIDLSESNSSGSTLSGLRALANDVPSAAPLVTAIEAMLAQTHQLVAQARDLERRANESEIALRAASRSISSGMKRSTRL